MPIQPHKGSILAVDDDRVTLDVLGRHLIPLGYRVDTAQNGREALAALNEGAYDVVLLDIVMPGMNGLAVLKELRIRAPETEVIMMTGSASLEDIGESLREGAFDYLGKPFILEDLTLTIDRARSQHENLILKRTGEFGRWLLSERELFPMLSDGAERLRRLMRADHVSILMADEDGGLRMVAAAGLPTRIVRETKIKLGERVAGKVAASRQSLLLVDSLDHHEDFQGLDVHRAVRSSIVHPLIQEDRVIGVLCLSRVRASHLFNVRDQKGGEVLAGLLVAGIERARAHERLALRHDEDLSRAYVDLREAHARLRAAQDLAIEQEKFSAIGKFAAVIAHHLKNPLSIAMSNVQLALKEAADGHAASQLKDAVDQIRKANHLIMDMLKTAAPTEAVGSRTPVSVEDWVREILEEVSPKLRDRNVTAEMEGVPADWRVAGDRGALDMVLMNLVMNAVEAMPDGGRLRITGRKDSAEGFVSLTILDTGRGMTEDQVRQAGRPFVTSKEEGVGLGLYSAKLIVELHGGHLEVESRLGEGTAIVITLPLLPAEESRPAPSR